MSELLNLQKAFTGHLRDPDHMPVPTGLDERRMGIYSELIFNNLSALLCDFFPVINSILSEEEWEAMIRAFFISHQSQTPYFPQISGEFVEYLSNRQISDGLPDFLNELAHYEWIELALYTLEEDLPAAPVDEDAIGNTPLALSPLAQPIAYRYPVHQISPDFQPEEPPDNPTFLLVTRDANESIHFFELQPLSFQLLHEIQENPGLVAEEWLSAAADELGHENKSEFIRNGVALLKSFNEQRIFQTD